MSVSVSSPITDAADLEFPGGGGKVVAVSGDVVEGDIIIGNSTPAWARLAHGSEGDVLTVASGLPAWAAPSGGLPAVGAEGDLLGVVSGVWASATITIGFDGGEET
jgi:hypothetical protein